MKGDAVVMADGKDFTMMGMGQVKVKACDEFRQNVES